MKNIEAILADAKLEITDDQKKAILDDVKENYKPVEDWKKQKEKVETLEDTLKEAQEALKKFEGVDTEALKGEIEKLNKQLEENKNSYEKQIAERDFSDIIEKAIAEAKGKNAKAIKALLDLDEIKSSKNQKEDLAKALKDLAEAEDSKMLFGEPGPIKETPAKPIGTVKKDNGGEDNQTLQSAVASFYAAK